MMLRVHASPPPLRGLVEHFWSFAAPAADPNGPAAFHLCAQSRADLIFGRRGVPEGDAFAGVPELVLIGPHDEYRSHVMRDRVEFIGATFSAEMIPPFFGIPAGEIRNRRFHLRDLSLPGIDELMDQLCRAPGTDRALEHLAGFLMRRIAEFHAPEFHGAIRFFREARGTGDIHRLAELTGLSRRQFERNFQGHTGFSPRLYARLLRFTAAMHAPAAYGDLTSLAYDLGYCDQSHFIREFKRFSGHNPKVLLDSSRVDTLLRI